MPQMLMKSNQNKPKSLKPYEDKKCFLHAVFMVIYFVKKTEMLGNTYIIRLTERF
jgi:hypothetical protein